MKALKTLTIALAVSSFSFGALAATEITQAQVKQNNYQQLGAVGSTNEAMDPMDVKKSSLKKPIRWGASIMSSLRLLKMKKPEQRRMSINSYR